MKDKCMVTVMCTAYNHEEYISRALDSVLKQQVNFDFEILVNDDLSTDGTAAIIRQYEAKYPDTVRAFYQKENLYSLGKDVYYELFFPEARGKYVAFCEGDDYWTDDSKLQLQVDFLESHPEYSACVHDSMLHYCAGDKPDEPLIGESEDKDLPFSCIVEGPVASYHTSSLLAKTELLAQPPDYYYIASSYGFGDYPYALWLEENGKIRFLARSMSVYRLNSNQSSWSSGVSDQYSKLHTFIKGKLALLNAYLPHALPEKQELVRKVIREREFELMYIEGRDIEQRRPPYRDILLRQSRSYRIKNFIKSYLPALQRIYRRGRGYREE